MPLTKTKLRYLPRLKLKSFLHHHLILLTAPEHLPTQSTWFGYWCFQPRSKNVVITPGRGEYTLNQAKMEKRLCKRLAAEHYASPILGFMSHWQFTPHIGWNQTHLIQLTHKKQTAKFTPSILLFLYLSFQAILQTTFQFVAARLGTLEIRNNSSATSWRGNNALMQYW